MDFNTIEYIKILKFFNIIKDKCYQKLRRKFLIVYKNKKYNY